MVLNPVYCAIDNCDFINDTHEGKMEFHGTGQIVLIQDSSNTEGNNLKQSLLSIFTRPDLTEYLTKHVIIAIESIQKPYVILYNKKCISNIASYPDDWKSVNQEETDTLKILLAPNVAELKPFFEHTIISPVDAFILLMCYYSNLCNRTVFRTGKCSQVGFRLGACYKFSHPEHAESLLSFHNFLG